MRASKEPGIVARVEADGRLIEHVEDARQAAADLAGEPNPLALAARERWGCLGPGSGIPGRRRRGTCRRSRTSRIEVARDVTLVVGEVEVEALDELARVWPKGPAADLVEGVASRNFGRSRPNRRGAGPPMQVDAGDVIDHPLEA